MSERKVQTEVESSVTTDRFSKWLRNLYRLSIVIIAVFIALSTILFVGRAAVYKIHAYERGLHLRGGKFIRVEEPGWHAQIPLVDTVIIVEVNERLGYVENIPAMTSDDVTMNVSLQYTYRVINPERYALDVADPERIVFEFVQGKLRDVVNTKTMTAVMHSRSEMSREVMAALQEKEEQYGVRFVTVQMQNASPPAEVVTAIKDRMVAAQRQEQAQAEAAQQKTLADAAFYAAQKEAEADALRISLAAEAQQSAVRAILTELEGKGALAEKYLDYLIVQELRENSKWVISDGASMPIIDLSDSPGEPASDE
jgi:regulator of protease activity HflC (stomatin/prohibitin superfamily)